MRRRWLGLAGLGALVALGVLARWKLVRDREGGETRGGAGGKGEPALHGGGRLVDVATVVRGAIEGTVRDPAGSPIAAEVCASGVSSSDSLADDDLREPVCATAGADGRYRLSGLAPARYWVEAAGAHFSPGRYRHGGRDTSIGLGAGEERRGVDITLLRGGVELAGTVSDIGGGAIEGAWVRAVQFQHGWAGEAVGAARARSLADGSFRLWVAPGEVHLGARADGYAKGGRAAAAPARRVEILLTPESSLSGRVVDAATGRGVAGARVATMSDMYGADPETSRSTRAATRADEQGRFRFRGLMPGRYKPTGTSPSGYGHARESVLLGLGQSVDGVVVELHPAGAVKGRVVVAGDESPCLSGYVGLDEPHAGLSRQERIEPDGRVAFEGILPGRYHVGVACDDFLADDPVPDVVVAHGVTTAEQRWTVRRGAVIRGTVRSSVGAPVARASILANVRKEGGPARGGVGSTSSEPDGTFQIRSLSAGTYDLFVEAADQPAAEPVVVTVSEGGEATVDIRLGVGGEVTGDVVDEQGQPVAGVVVGALPVRGGDSMRRGSMAESAAHTVDDGSFALRGLPAGLYQVTASRGEVPWGGRRLRAPGKRDDDIEKVEVVAGRTARVHLVVESQSGIIRGRVVDGRGGAISDAFVDAEPDSDPDRGGSAGRELHGWWRAPVLTDSEGGFAIARLAPGTYTLRAYRRGGGEALVGGVAIGARVTLTIRPTGSIEGALESEDAAIPDEFRVLVSDRETGFSRGESFFRTAGRFALRDLPPGSFTLSVSAAEGSGAAEAHVAEGQNLTGIAVRLRGRANLTGRVISLDQGKPLPGYSATITSVAPDGDASFDFGILGSSYSTSGADGRFAAKGVPSGRVQVMVAADSQTSRYGMWQRTLELAPGATDLGDLRVPPVRVAPGQPPGDLGFALVAPGPSFTVGAIRADGPAAKSGLQVGDVIVSVDGHDVHGDSMAYQGLSTVPPGTTVTFGLARGDSVRITAVEFRR